MTSRKTSYLENKDWKENAIRTTVISNDKMAFCQPAPFTDDAAAVKIRDECDYSIKITKEMAESGQAPRAVRIYADGVYDLFHEGHGRLLMQAKNVFSNVHLIAGVPSDKTTYANKGKTIMCEKERYEIVSHCRYVDEVIPDAPWIINEEFILKNKIDFVAHDEHSYPSGDTGDPYKMARERGIFIATQRTDGVSTSDIISRFVNDYDACIRRNLARGYARDMNI